VLPGFLIQAEPVVEKPGNASIHEAIMDMVPVPPSGQDAHILEAPELVGNRRGLHAHRFGEIPHAGIALDH
jgi:hypothetical protein